MAVAAVIKNEAPPANLVEKLAAVMAQVERVPKSGHNAFHNYDYATEADITDAVRSAMARFGVMLIPSVEKVEWGEVATKNGAAEKLCTLHVKFTATDGKDQIEFTILGQGQDRGDKATYKAMTGANKYALLKLFLIPTGDDPEREEDEKPHTGSRAPARPAPAAVPAPGHATPNPHSARVWAKAKAQLGDKAQKAFALAAEGVFAARGEASKPTAEWTAEDAAAVEKVLFDVPF